LRQMAGIESVGAIVFWFQASAALVGAVLIPFMGFSPAPGTMAILIIAGLFGGLGQIWMTASLHAAPVAVLTPFDYIQLILAALLGWVLIGTLPTPYTWAGAVLIGGSGFYTMWRERQLHLQRQAVSATQPMVSQPHITLAQESKEFTAPTIPVSASRGRRPRGSCPPTRIA